MAMPQPGGGGVVGYGGMGSGQASAPYMPSQSQGQNYPMGPPSGMGMGPPSHGMGPPPNAQVYDFPAGLDDEVSGGPKGKKKRETKKKQPAKEKEPKAPKTPKTPKTPKNKAASASSSASLGLYLIFSTLNKTVF